MLGLRIRTFSQIERGDEVLEEIERVGCFELPEVVAPPSQRVYVVVFASFVFPGIWGYLPTLGLSTSTTLEQLIKLFPPFGRFLIANTTSTTTTTTATRARTTTLAPSVTNSLLRTSVHATHTGNGKTFAEVCHVAVAWWAEFWGGLEHPAALSILLWR